MDNLQQQNGSDAQSQVVSNSQEQGKVSGQIAAQANILYHNYRALLGFLGAALLLIGVFIPVVSLPVVGSVNYFGSSAWDGSFIIFMACVSVLFVLAKKYTGLWFTGGISFSLIGLFIINFFLKVSELKASLDNGDDNLFGGLAKAALDAVQLQWGIAILAIGSILLFVSAALKQQDNLPIDNKLSVIVNGYYKYFVGVLLLGVVVTIGVGAYQSYKEAQEAKFVKTIGNISQRYVDLNEKLVEESKDENFLGGEPGAFSELIDQSKQDLKGIKDELDEASCPDKYSSDYKKFLDAVAVETATLAQVRKVLGKDTNSASGDFVSIRNNLAEIQKVTGDIDFISDKVGFASDGLDVLADNLDAFAAAKEKLEQIKKLKKELSVSAVEKDFIPSDIWNGEYEDRITIKFVFTNLGNKAIRGFSGQIVFKDMFGEEIYASNLSYDEGLGIGKKKSWIGSMDYNEFLDEHQKLKTTSLSNMKFEWVPKQILFTDGTKLEIND